MAKSIAFYRRAKWAGLALSLLLLGLYVFSYLHVFYWGKSYDYMALARGQIGHYAEFAETPGGGPPTEYFAPYPRWEISLGWCFLATAIATAWLWYQARSRIVPGHCACCGYDLTGNISGICPECGTPARVLGGDSDHTRPSPTSASGDPRREEVNR
jgi:hypothetical protein